MNRWEGRVAIVTGASAGIGADIAKQLAIEGLQVVGLARRKERIDQLAKELPKDCKGKLYGYKCNISDEKEAKEAFAWVEKLLGGISVLVNNAGLIRSVTFDGTLGEVNGWKEILDTNVLGLSICSRLALISMRKHQINDGQFININSVAGHMGVFFPSAAMYSASKHAVLLLTEGLRKEVVQLKTKIRVTSISPGGVRTEIAQGLTMPKEAEEFFKNAPILEPEHITAGVLYVLSAPPIVNISELIIKPVGEAL